MKLMVSTPSSLNDPFEFFCKITGEMTKDKAKKYIDLLKNIPEPKIKPGKTGQIISQNEFIKRIEKKENYLIDSFTKKYTHPPFFRPNKIQSLADGIFRITCFSSQDISNQEDILMWSHYANKHQGVRITFNLDIKETRRFSIQKVQYKDECPEIDLSDIEVTESTKRSMINAISTKSPAWNHEKEYRLFVERSSCSTQKGNDGIIRSFIEINPKEIIGVDIGLRFPYENIGEIKKLIQKQYPWIKLRQVNPGNGTYSIKYEEI